MRPLPARPRVLVCGTGFGRAYLSAFDSFDEVDFPFDLAGILARGSERSRLCATARGVPLYTSVDKVPDDVDVACVVVGSAARGGPGTQVAQEFLWRGVHVLQEHPVLPDEIVRCVAAARATGAAYAVNTHHVHLEPVRRFVEAAALVGARQPPLFVEMTTAFPVLETALDIVARALGRVRPATLVAVPTTSASPFRTLEGTIAGVPACVRVQHELDPSQPDNNAHMWHRITIGSEGGTLTLVSTHGPVVWCPRPHLPRDAAQGASLLATSSAPHLEYPAATTLGPADAPSWRDAVNVLWPSAVREAVYELRRSIEDGDSLTRRAQHHLAVASLTRAATEQLGRASLVPRPEPEVLPAPVLTAAVAS